MGKFINDFSLGLLLWQAFLFGLILVFLYILYKVVKKVSKW